MTSPPLSPERFREEVEQRLIDGYDVMHMADLRSREGVAKRVSRGLLPPPVWKGIRMSLWDRNEVAERLAQQG